MPTPSETYAFGLRKQSGSTEYFFRPGCVKIINRRSEFHQDRVLCESGLLYVSELAADVMRTREITIDRLHYGQETEGAWTWDGWQQFKGVLESDCRNGLYTFQIKRPGVINNPGNWTTYRQAEPFIDDQEAQKTDTATLFNAVVPARLEIS